MARISERVSPDPRSNTRTTPSFTHDAATDVPSALKEGPQTGTRSGWPVTCLPRSVR